MALFVTQIVWSVCAACTVYDAVKHSDSYLQWVVTALLSLRVCVCVCTCPTHKISIATYTDAVDGFHSRGQKVDSLKAC